VSYAVCHLRSHVPRIPLRIQHACYSALSVAIGHTYYGITSSRRGHPTTGICPSPIWQLQNQARRYRPASRSQPSIPRVTLSARAAVNLRCLSLLMSVSREILRLSIACARYALPRQPVSQHALRGQVVYSCLQGQEDWVSSNRRLASKGGLSWKFDALDLPKECHPQHQVDSEKQVALLLAEKERTKPTRGELTPPPVTKMRKSQEQAGLWCNALDGSQLAAYSGFSMRRSSKWPE
jgi:hypothetical protein